MKVPSYVEFDPNALDDYAPIHIVVHEYELLYDAD